LKPGDIRKQLAQRDGRFHAAPVSPIADLCCPRCKQALAATERCDTSAIAFPTAAGLPVLIDFADSICTAEDFVAATIERPKDRASSIGAMIQRITYGSNDSTRENIARFADLAAESGSGRVLVIGGGTEGAGTEPLYRHAGLEVVGTDIYPAQGIAVICDGHSLPFQDNSFDGVLIQAVLEHVLDPQRVVGEIERVLRPDGVV
jgi:SAM-dependent methyltransferase